MTAIGRPMGSLWHPLVFGLALAAGLGFFLGALRLSGAVMFSAAPGAGVILSWLSPLAGIAGFAAVYGPGRGRALRARFWLVAVALVYGLGALGMAATWSGAVSLPVAFAPMVVGAFVGAVLLYLRDRDHG